MKMEMQTFGVTKYGEIVTAYTLETEKLRLRVLDRGATIQSVWVRNRNGAWVDVALGYDTVAEYESRDGYLGACVGRVANRLGGAAFTLNGVTYPLAKNNGNNHLHGGLRGFDQYIWQAEALEDGIRFSRISPDGEEGYPGKLTVSVTYRVVQDGFQMEYDAVSDRDTLCSLTNHTYWNLTGDGSALDHVLQIHADRFLENSEECLPTGKILPVEGTPFDFRQPKKIGREIGAADVNLKNGSGYDHNFCLPETGALIRAAVLQSEKSGISMAVDTTMPGVQLYTGNFLGPWPGKGGKIYNKRDGVCLETQYYPNAMVCDFKKPILRAGERYHHVTRHTFWAD